MVKIVELLDLLQVSLIELNAFNKLVFFLVELRHEGDFLILDHIAPIC